MVITDRQDHIYGRSKNRIISLKRFINFLFAVCAIAATGISTTCAAIIDFTTASEYGEISFTRTFSDGSATANFYNPITQNGGEYFYYDNIFNLVMGSAATTYSFNVMFDQDVTLYGIGVGFVRDNAGFDVFGEELDVSDILAGVNTTGFYTLDTPLNFLGGEEYFFTSNNWCLGTASNAGCGGIGFTSWDFSPTQVTAVPLPATLPLMLTGLGSMAWVRRRKKSHSAI